MYLLHRKKIDIYTNISLFFSYSEVTVATRSGPYPAQMITAVNRSSLFPDQMVDQHLETTSTALNISGDQGTLMSPRDRSPVRTLSPRHLSGKYHWKQWSPYNLTLLQLELNYWFVWPEENWSPNWAWFLPRFFSPFCHRWSFGSLPLSPLACLVVDTSFPAISLTWYRIQSNILLNSIMKCL